MKSRCLNDTYVDILKTKKTICPFTFYVKRTVSSISNGLQWEVDEHVYICYQNNQRGIAGVAWLRSTCSIYQYYRTNINEWISNDANAARVRLINFEI